MSVAATYCNRGDRRLAEETLCFFEFPIPSVGLTVGVPGKEWECNVSRGLEKEHC